MRPIIERHKREALDQAAARLGGDGDSSQEPRLVLDELWDLAFEEGRLAALDEFQDRFCVCMK